MKRIPAFLLMLLALSLPVGCENGFPFNHDTTAPTPPPNPLSVAVTIVGYSYPAAVTIRPGGYIDFVNQSGTDHTVQPMDAGGNCIFPSDNIVANGSTLSVTFLTAGDFEYHCNWYGGCNNNCSTCWGMAGVIHVE